MCLAHVAWEENPPTEVQSIRVALRATDRGPYSGTPELSKPSRTELFVIKNVEEGIYKPHVFTGSWGMFFEVCRIRGADVTDGGLAVHAGTDAALELKLSCRAARIEGVVLTRDSVPASGVYVVAIPDAPHRDNEWWYRAELTDQNGRFLLRAWCPENTGFLAGILTSILIGTMPGNSSRTRAKASL